MKIPKFKLYNRKIRMLFIESTFMTYWHLYYQQLNITFGLDHTKETTGHATTTEIIENIRKSMRNMLDFISKY